MLRGTDDVFRGIRHRFAERVICSAEHVSRSVESLARSAKYVRASRSGSLVPLDPRAGWAARPLGQLSQNVRATLGDIPALPGVDFHLGWRHLQLRSHRPSGNDVSNAPMKFEWDPEKASANVRKHGVSFEEAVTVFYDSLATTFPDPDHSVGEVRLITFGYSAHDKLLVVAHAERRETARIISARHATAHERKRYEAQNPRGRR